MSVLGTSRSHFGHQRFCWIRVWHSPCSWLKLSVAPASVAGNTLIGMFTRLILRYPFHVGRAAISFSRAATPPLLFQQELLVDVHLELTKSTVRGVCCDVRAAAILIVLAHLDRDETAEERFRLIT